MIQGARSWKVPQFQAMATGAPVGARTVLMTVPLEVWTCWTLSTPPGGERLAYCSRSTSATGTGTSSSFGSGMVGCRKAAYLTLVAVVAYPPPPG